MILVGVDGSETSLRAAAYAAGLARLQRTELVCLYVRTSSGLATMAPAASGVVRQCQDDIAAELRRGLEQEAVRLGLDARLVEARGNPYHELVRLADELRVDAIVVGASMQASHRLVGSLASHLVRKARWPVTVVP